MKIYSFIIWDLQNNKIALAIELDDKSHNSEKMQVRDEFVNRLYKETELRLVRVNTETDFRLESARINDKL